MPEIFTKAKKAIVLNRLLGFRAGLYIVGSLCGSIQTGLAGAQWSACDFQTRLLIIVGMLGTLVITLRAFVDQTAAKISQGELPFSDAEYRAEKKNAETLS